MRFLRVVMACVFDPLLPGVCPLQKKLCQKLGKLGFLGFSKLSKLVELNQQA